MAAFAVASGLAATAFAAPFAYVTNSGSNNVSVIDVATNTVVATVPVGNAPLAVAVAPGGSRAYVANLFGGDVSVINTATNTVVATVPGVDYPQGIALNPAGTRAYVTNAHLDRVSVIDTASNSVVGSIPVNYYPVGIAISPAGSRAYVVHNGASNVIVLDTSTNTQVATVPTGPFPYGVAVHPSGTLVYVTNTNSSDVTVIDASTNTVAATVPVGTYPIGVAFNPSGTRAYVANAGASSVSVIDTATSAVIATVGVGSGPRGVGVNPAGTLAYVSNDASATISVIDTATNGVVATVAVGSSPYAFGLFIGGPLVNPPTQVININDSGPGSLRQVLTDAASFCSGGPTITFNIPGIGPHVIMPRSQLPALTCAATFLDGYSQGFTQFNTMLDGSNSAQIKIELDGSACGSCNGITIGNGSMVRGLAIYSFLDAQVHATSSAFVYGNYLGADSTGTVRGGIDGVVAGGGFVRVGDGGAANLNLITGMVNAGVRATASSSNLQVDRNQIGGTRGGTAGAGNGVGILVDRGQSAINQNFIRYNRGAGIVIPATNFSENLFAANLAYGNVGPGIDLNDDGATANDEASVPYDSDGGPNQLTNYPVITSVVHVGSDTVIDGYLKSNSDGDAVVELFRGTSAPPAGVTQGEIWIDSFPLSLDGNGFASFSRTITGVFADYVSATATTDVCSDGCVYSSEYSPSVAVSAAPLSQVLLTPLSLTFAPRTIGTSSPPQTVTLTNTSTFRPLVIPLIDNTGEFAFASACSLALGPGASCDIEVKFGPTVVGPSSGALRIVSDDIASPHRVPLSGTGLSTTAPVISISATTVDFPPQPVGTQGDPQFVVIANSGNATLDLGSASVGPGFVLLPDSGGSSFPRCSVSLGAGNSCVFAIVFGPTLAGLADTFLTIPSNDARSPTLVRLVGTGIVGVPARALTVPALLAFSSVPVGTHSDGVPLTIVNGGASPVSITELSASGDFSISNTCTTIAAHASCAPLVTFAPTVIGDRTGSVTIRTFSEAQPYVVALGGVGTPNLVPQITVSVTRIGFGNTLLGVPSGAQALVRNVGQVPVVIESVTASGDYLVSHACGITIAVGATCTLNVGFYPLTTGGRLGEVVIRTNAAGSPHSVQVTGVGCALPSLARARSGQSVCGP